MFKRPVAVIAAASLLALGACSKKTEDSAAATANSAGNDIEANTDHMTAGAENASASAAPTLDRTGDKIENAAGDAARATGNALDSAGHAITNAAEDAKH